MTSLEGAIEAVVCNDEPGEYLKNTAGWIAEAVRVWAADNAVQLIVPYGEGLPVDAVELAAFGGKT